MSRTPLDNWSKREQLCLASAVSCSGDQNWITVSRTLKSVCGNGSNTRPADWYSQKNCAMQYGHLLETVESTKRKKRTNESNAGFSSPSTVTVETPTELLLRRLTEERLQEIKTQMRRDQELFSQIQREIEALQKEEFSEQQLQQMWQEIEKEQETKRIDEMKLENRMREREQRKKDMVGNWRSNSGTARRSNLTADTTSVDMDVEDIAGLNAGAANNKQQSTSAPMLTSLLKSPGSNGSNATSLTAGSATCTTTSTGTTGVARAITTAPTITSLLTSGAGAIPNQPAIIMKSPSDTAFMTRPISGPPIAEVTTTGRSPSQAAPTLSMLLEKNKLAAAAMPKSNESPTKTADAELNSSLKQSSAESESAEAAEDAIDESYAEEQQLLEVFKNMDDIMDDIDIDIDEDILKEVDSVESPTATGGKAEDFEDKLDALKREQNETRNSSKSPVLPKPVELVVGSSDDSNDNIPLAAVASQESKDRTQEMVDESSEAKVNEAVVEELSETITIASSSSEENAQDAATVTSSEVEAFENINKTAVAGSKAATPEPVKAAKENTQNQEAKQAETANEELEAEPSKLRAAELDKLTTEPKTASKTQLPEQDTDGETFSLLDSSKSDEPARSVKTRQQAESKFESEPSTATRQTPPSSSSTTTTPTPTATPAPAPVTVRAPLLRKLPHRDRSESPMVDDDATTASDQSTARSSTRRRCSSTPVIDSIPNSPASSEHTDDRRETRAASKKLFLSIYHSLLESKHAVPFKRALLDEHMQKHADLCLRPMDLPSIKRNIDSGQIRSLSELQRDIVLMCQNLLLVYKPQTNQHKTARLFMQECRAVKEFAGVAPTPGEVSTNTPKVEKEKEKEKERTPAGNKQRSGSRKSQRHH